jgi:hypothetical protein
LQYGIQPGAYNKLEYFSHYVDRSERFVPLSFGQCLAYYRGQLQASTSPGVDAIALAMGMRLRNNTIYDRLSHWIGEPRALFDMSHAGFSQELEIIKAQIHGELGALRK